MTLLGKVLVFVNLLLSLLMLSWAAAVVTNRIDWSSSPAKEGKPAGVLKGREDRVKAAWVALANAEVRWRDARNGNDGKDGRERRDGLPAWEQRRLADRGWYADELKAAKTGPGGNVKAPINWVKIKDGQPLLDPKNLNRPQMEPAQRRKEKPEEPVRQLFSNQYYLDELARLTDEIIGEQDRFQKLVKDETELTEKAIGPKGLRQRIADELVKSGRVDDELKDLDGRKTNSLVDTELLLARQEQLERRVEELKKAREKKE